MRDRAIFFGEIVGLAVLVCILTPGPIEAQDPSSESPAAASGFLEDYGLLQPVESLPGLEIFKRGEKPLRGFRRFLVEPVEIYRESDDAPLADRKGILARFAGFLREDIIRRLERSRRYSAVSEAGPGVARVRMALVDVPSIQLDGTDRENTGRLELMRLILDSAPGIRQVSLELEIVDSETGDSLIAIVDRRAGSRFIDHHLAKERGEKARSLLREYLHDLRSLIAEEE